LNLLQPFAQRIEMRTHQYDQSTNFHNSTFIFHSKKFMTWLPMKIGGVTIDAFEQVRGVNNNSSKQARWVILNSSEYFRGVSSNSFEHKKTNFCKIVITFDLGVFFAFCLYRWKGISDLYNFIFIYFYKFLYYFPHFSIWSYVTLLTALENPMHQILSKGRRNWIQGSLLYIPIN